ncbi:MAG: hypothetical protein ABI837_06795 [Acidobacteriota bacterium]
MTEDPFIERLREEATQLRYAPDEHMFVRLAAKVRERIQGQPSVSQLLALWFRPVATSLAALAIAASLGLSWVMHTQETVAVDQIATSTTQTSADADVYSVGE